MDCSRRSFIGGATCLGLAGCASPGTMLGSYLRLRFGVLSDIHITDWASTEIFRKTLRYFDSRHVDAVMIAGDMADHGILPQLENVAKAWFEVFPNDRGSDGRKVERLFIYGNHDPEGLAYRDAAMDKAFKAMNLTYEEAEKLKLSAIGLDKCWEQCFHEPYSPIYVKQVRGYDFIGGHWDKANGSGWGSGPCIDEWMNEHASEIDTTKPFFYFQHPHPRGTVYANDAWGNDGGAAVRALSPYANAVAFSGHSHASLTDDRSYWRGEFTSIGTSTLSYVSLPRGRVAVPNYRDNLDCRQGQIVNVFEDRLVIERRDFIHDEQLGPDVVLEMPTKVSTFSARSAAKRNEPRFAEWAKVEFESGAEGLTVKFPGAFGNPSALPYEYKVGWAFDDENGKNVRWEEMKYYQAKVVFARRHSCKADNLVLFPKAKLPGKFSTVKVYVTPMNCYGGAGPQLQSGKFSPTRT